MQRVRALAFAACAITLGGAVALCPPAALALNEREVGDNYHKQLSSKYRVYRDARVTEIGKKVSEAAGVFDVDFYAIDMGKDDQPNAFQIPYHIYATKSLLEKFDDVSVTFILAHEMGHQVGHHLAKDIKKSQTVGIGAALLGAILGVGSNSLGGYAINIAGGAIVNKYSREQEQEADLFGLESIHDMGIPFDKAAESFKKLAGDRKESRTLNSLFGSHPMMKDRVERAGTADQWLFMRATDAYRSGSQTVAVVWPYMIEKPLPDKVQKLRASVKSQMPGAGYKPQPVDTKARVWAKMHRIEQVGPDDVKDVADTLGVSKFVVVTEVTKKNVAKGVVLKPASATRSAFEWPAANAEEFFKKLREAL